MKKLSKYEKLLNGSYTEFELKEDAYLLPAPVADAMDDVVAAARELADNYGDPGIEDFCDCATFYSTGKCVHKKLSLIHI